ncbi:3-phenylpropionate/cinnamic acid dioxygenase ferredoxin subunit-like [Branchiostoma floridae x Branchiostoma belcheri]
MSLSDDYLFFKVENVHISDLYDWSDPKQKGKYSRPKLKRRESAPSGSLVHINEEKIALFRHGETVYAIQERCPHMGGPLHLGDIEELPDKTLCVRCPWHSWRFSLNTGHAVLPKKDKVAVTFPVKVDTEGNISLGFLEFASDYFSGSGEF